MQIYQTQNTSKWGPVLTALYRVNRFTSPVELVEPSGLDLDTVEGALAFLLQQGWIEKLADDNKYACVYQAKAVIQSLERSKVL